MATTGPTTVLDKGTVESRGHGSTKSQEAIHSDIRQFLKSTSYSPQAEARSFFSLWIFLTRLPAPVCFTPDLHAGYLMQGMAYMTIIGSGIGGFASLWADFVLSIKLPASVAACVATASTFVLTGCFHEDGLADSGDGFGGGWSTSQVLRIMQDTRLGTYGVCVLLIYVTTKVALLTGLDNSHWEWYKCDGVGPALLVAHSVARIAAPFLLRTRTYVDEGGPKGEFYRFMMSARFLCTWPRVFLNLIYAGLLANACYGFPTALLLLATSISAAYMAGQYAEPVLGGVMGDFLGATICVTEVVLYATISIRQSLLYAVNLTFVYVNLLVFNFSSIGDTISLIQGLWNEWYGSASWRLFIGLLITKLWSAMVGPGDVFVRDLDGAENVGGSRDTPVVNESCRVLDEQISRENKNLTFRQKYDLVRERIDTLAKPVGSLGTLEDWAARLAVLAGTSRPTCKRSRCLIFAADHGVASAPENGGEGCSAYPQAVTRSILDGLGMGIAGACVLAKSNQTELSVIDVGVLGHNTRSATKGGGILKESTYKLVNGTKNACTQPSMSHEEVKGCLQAGRDEVRTAVADGVDLLTLGEVGIGNTTTASLVLAALTGQKASDVCDGGATTGREVDEALILRKIGIVQKGLNAHKLAWNNDPMEVLRTVGGAEMASIVGALLEASIQGLPVLIDGFIVTVCALVAARLDPSVSRVLFLASQSTERGQKVALSALKQIVVSHDELVASRPLLDMSLRMGEGTAALMAVPIARSACAMLEMGTITDILSGKSG